jgi:hypothetical protein
LGRRLPYDFRLPLTFVSSVIPVRSIPLGKSFDSSKIFRESFSKGAGVGFENDDWRYFTMER